MSAPQIPNSSIVAHVVVVGFHAQLGNRIEFAYPRLRGDPILRSPKLWDTSDISADISTPTIVRRNTPTHVRKFDSPPQPPPPTSQPNADWGVLPDEWSFLPFMALPDGVHDSASDVVFFTLPPDVHCVSCFRQVDAIDAKTHSASTGNLYEQGVAARGSVQKSVVLLCRRPLFGVLADRLVPAVRAYFDQGDFARTDVLASLYHSVNLSLCRPSLQDAETLFHGLDLRQLLRKLGPQTLAVLKLIMLERRIVVYSQPVEHASNAVVALASVFQGALDSIAPTMHALEGGEEANRMGFPLRLFGVDDRVALQPYAPLPLLSELIPNESQRACLVGTSHNVGLLLSSTASAAARKAVAAKRQESPIVQSARMFLQQAGGMPESKERVGGRGPSLSDGEITPLKHNMHTRDVSMTPASTKKPKGGSRGVPVVDALVNLANGKVSVSGTLEPLCRITRVERRFMRDLMISASSTAASVSSSGSYIGSDDYIRQRLREYLNSFLRSVASIDGVLGGPAGWETWSAEMVDDFGFAAFEPYNEKFVRAWMQTRNAAEWARQCQLKGTSFEAPPKPELDGSLLDEQLLPVDQVAARLSGLRQNVFDFGRLSSIVSSRAAEGLSGFFRRVEEEVAKMDSAVANTSNTTGSRAQRVSGRTGNSRGEDLTDNASSAG